MEISMEISMGIYRDNIRQQWWDMKSDFPVIKHGDSMQKNLGFPLDIWKPLAGFSTLKLAH